MRVKLQTETPAKQGSLLGRTGVLNSRIFSDEKCRPGVQVMTSPTTGSLASLRSSLGPASLAGRGAGGRCGKASSALPGNQLSSRRAPINAPSSRVPCSVQENKLGHNNKGLTNSKNNKEKRCVVHLASDQCVACPCRRPSTSSASSSSSSPSS